MKIAYSGFIADQSGYGEAARRNIMALRVAGADVRRGIALRWDQLAELPDSIQQFLNEDPHDQPDIHLIHAFARDFSQIPPLAPRQIGLSCWETDRLPDEYVLGSRAVDLVIVPSRQNLEVFQKAGIRTAMIPYPVIDQGQMTPIPQCVSMESGHIFFGSIGTWQRRKNPEGTVTAFMTADWGVLADRVVLVMVIGGTAVGYQAAKNEIDYLVKALNLPHPRPKILLLCGLSIAHLSWLHKTAAGYVSLTRGEGFGFPVSDACRGGRAIVATDWGGHLDVLTTAAGVPRCGVRLVPSRLAPVSQLYPLFNGHMYWADPNLQDAQHALVDIAHDGLAGQRRYERDLSAFSLQTIGQQLVQVCQETLDGH